MLWGGGVFGLGYFSITKVFGATLLALRGGAGWQLSMGKKCYPLHGFTFSGAIYKVDFDKFTVSGGAADMPVRRLAVKGSVYDSNHHTFVTEWYWHWLNEHLKWIPFITRV